MDIDELISRAKGVKKKDLQDKDLLFELHLNYDSVAETLEPVYFWILDFMQDKAAGVGMEVEKLVDNFTASPGSGYFADIGIRATRMQEQGMKILATINTVMRSVLNLIYDLKEFEIRLKHYENYKSKDKKLQQAGILALKQVWMDRVDIRRGAGSLNLLTQQLDFVTLRDAFMYVNRPEDVDKLDVNERVKRILKPRIAEFLDWVTRSEKEIKNRYEIEKTYLTSQINAIKLYTRWVRPYLRAAEELTMKQRDLKRAELVTAFNTVVMELSIFGKARVDTERVRTAAMTNELPRKFDRVKLKRNFYACVFVDFVFRGIPRTAARGEGVHYVHSGRTNVTFKAFVLNEDELKELYKELDKDDIYEGLRLVEGVTLDTLGPIQEELQKYLETESYKSEKEKKPRKTFIEVLFGLKPSAKKAEKARKKAARKENFVERQVRYYTEAIARARCWRIYDIYKKAHGMGSPPFPFTFRTRLPSQFVIK